MTAMPRLVLAVLLVSACVACSAAGPPATWQKPGASAATVANDTSDCRALASGEARRRYPSDAGFPGQGPAGVIMVQQQDDTNRIGAENELFGTCMQNRGYTRVQPAQR